MNWRWTAGLTAGALLLAGRAHAQGPATVREVVRVVKAAPAGAGAFQDARVGSQLAAGARVRTGGRSRAGVRFPDRSLLRMDELTEIIVADPRGRGARVTRGQVFADYKAPGTISGGYAVAAVRGTEVQYTADTRKRRAIVRCYEGQVFVAAANNPLVAGTTQELGATTFTDPALVGSTVNWVGGRIRFLSGPHAGQTVNVTAFDAQTGTVTFTAPQFVPVVQGMGPAGYVLIQNPNGKVVELGPQQGTTVNEGQEPQDPYGIPSEEFAGGERYPFFRDMYDGITLGVYPGTQEHNQQQERDFPSEEGIDRATHTGHGPTDPCDCFETFGRGRVRSGSRARTYSPAAQLARISPGLREAFGHDLTFASFGGTPSAPLPTPEERILPENVRPDWRALNFRFEPFGFLTTEGSAAGARVRGSTVAGTAYFELGYRFIWVDPEDGESDIDHDVSEALVHVRGRYGDVIAGRQHLFIGPANNTRLGTLLGLESVDAIVYETPNMRGFRQQIGYVIDSRAMEGGGYSAGYARGQAPLWRGRVGYSVLLGEGDRQTGWSVDAALPAIRNVLDVYGEAGENQRGRELYTAGLYFPGIYQTARIDTFVEYGRREGREERVSLRLRRDVGSGLLAIAFVDQRLGGGSLEAGAGFLWTHRFK